MSQGCRKLQPGAEICERLRRYFKLNQYLKSGKSAQRIEIAVVLQPFSIGTNGSDFSRQVIASSVWQSRIQCRTKAVPGTNDGIRAAVVQRLNANTEYRELFGKNFAEVKSGTRITYEMLARALAEFEFTLVFADAPIDKFARGQKNAMTADEKRGALIFFGAGNCVSCHAVSGQSNEMFSDFRQHVAAIPQIAPAIGNVTFDGPGANEDFGCFTSLEDAVRYHLDCSRYGAELRAGPREYRG